jgi:translation initiation factor IF-2
MGSGTLALSFEDDWEPRADAPGGAVPAAPALDPEPEAAAEPSLARLPEPSSPELLPAAEPPPPAAPALPDPSPQPVLSASPARSFEPDEPPAAPPPRRPPPPPPERPSLPTPSPALRRSLYERFERKR